MRSKRCISCRKKKPIRDFYRHPDMADGRLGKCKPCHRAAVRKNRAANVEYYRAYDRGRWCGDIDRRVATGRRANARRALEPAKAAARRAVAYALSAGLLRRQVCEVCGSLRVHAHHDNYKAPLAVRWLCAVHHSDVHRGVR